MIDTSLSIPSFGQDDANELYVCSFDGKIYTLQVVETTAPHIGVPTQVPKDPMPDQEVRVNVNVTDDLSGVKQVILSYSNNALWTNVTMSHKGGNLYDANVTAMLYQIRVKYKIIAFDNANNMAVEDNGGLFYDYVVVPEFSPALIIPAFLLVTLMVTVFRLRSQKL